MTPNVHPSVDGRSLTVHVPIAFVKRGGRKLVITPPGHDEWNPAEPASTDNILLAAVITAFRFKALLDADQGNGLSRTARGDRQPRPLGQGPCDPWCQPAAARRQGEW